VQDEALPEPVNLGHFVIGQPAFDVAVGPASLCG
jgi:hypothetical protein